MVAVQPIPAALSRVAAAVAVSVVVVVTAVRVVDRVAGARRRLRFVAVSAVVQTFLAVARPVADAVLEQLEAVDALRHRRAVSVQRHVVAALARVVLTRVTVALVLHTHRHPPTVRTQAKKVN